MLALMAKQMLDSIGIKIPVVTTLHGTDITLVGSNPSYKTAVEFSINNSDYVTGIGTGFNFAGNGRISYGYNIGIRDVGVYSNGNHLISLSYFIEGSRSSFSNYRGYKNGKMLNRRPYIQIFVIHQDSLKDLIILPNF